MLATLYPRPGYNLHKSCPIIARRVGTIPVINMLNHIQDLKPGQTVSKELLSTLKQEAVNSITLMGCWKIGSEQTSQYRQFNDPRS